MVDNKMGTKAQNNFEGDKLINEISGEVEKTLGLTCGDIGKVKPMSLWAMEKKLKLHAAKAMMTYDWYDYTRYMSIYHYVHQIRMDGVTTIAELIRSGVGCAKDIFECVVIVVAFAVALQKDDSETPPQRGNTIKWIENKLNRL